MSLQAIYRAIFCVFMAPRGGAIVGKLHKRQESRRNSNAIEECHTERRLDKHAQARVVVSRWERLYELERLCPRGSTSSLPQVVT